MPRAPSSLSPRTLQPQDTSQSGSRDVTLARSLWPESQNYFFFFSAFILSFELEYTGELQPCWYFCFLPFLAIATSSLPHRCTHVFWRGSFSYRLLQNVVYVSLCYILGLVTFLIVMCIC